MENVLNFDDENTCSDEERHFLLDQLNRIFSIHSHLDERLSEISEHPDLLKVNTAIIENIFKAQSQLHCLDKLSKMIAWNPSTENCSAIINLLEDYFNKLQFRSGIFNTSNFFLFDYLQTASAILTSSFSTVTQLTSNVRLHNYGKLIAVAGVVLEADNFFLPL